MEEKKRYRMTFRAGNRRKTLYASCVEAELQGEKERLAMFLETETGVAWHCSTVTEVDAKTVYVGERGGSD